MKKLSLTLLVGLFIVSCNSKETVVDSSTDSKETPTTQACTKEAKQCPDGTVVGRNPKNNCKFNACPKAPKKEVLCTADVKQCADGSFIGRDHNNNCKFKDCPGPDKALL